MTTTARRYEGITGVKHRIESSSPEEEEFERIQARQDAERPHEADARMLDAQFATDIEAFKGLCDEAKEDGLKYDSEKPRIDLLVAGMPNALEEISAVLTYGANKYAPGNWQHVDDAEGRYLAAQMRHELSYAKGNERDKETNLHELAHSACCALFRLELALRNR